ncbi:hypothetical protein HAX54_025588 [Datura stramonium]|uniref:Uncharacterized protein n=1 Tax=Datura stramonium TaxID=4076 RepID=A0ABS8V214_DATST|nr:hypothetical protein [Datura stramonium]
MPFKIILCSYISTTGFLQVKRRTANGNSAYGSHVMQFGDLHLTMDSLFNYMGTNPANDNSTYVDDNSLWASSKPVNQRDADLLHFWDKLVSGRDDFMIKVRLYRMWDTINPNKNGELITVEMIFIDVKNFKVVEATGAYKPVENSLTFIFTTSTVINNLSEDIVHIPINGFQFIKPAIIDSMVNNDKVLSDVVGCLYEIGGMENPGSTWKKRDIEIITD